LTPPAAAVSTRGHDLAGSLVRSLHAPAL